MCKRFWIYFVYAFIFSIPSVYALDLVGAEIHGFVSQGYLYSSDNNYLTAETSDGSFQFNELGINVSKELTDKLQIGIQVFSRDLGKTGNNDVEIDWAYGDYWWRSWLGLRVGLMKMAHGFYNETRDIDMVRTSVLLPQSVYPEVQRDFYTRMWGGELHGDIDMGRAGTLSYRGLIGSYTPDASSGGFDSIFEEVIPVAVDEHQNGIQFNGSLQWQTPLDGLRFGAMGWKMNDFQTDVKTVGQIGPVPPGLDLTVDSDIWSTVFSGEYTWENLKVAAEYRLFTMESTANVFGVESGGKTEAEGFYIGASYRFIDWFELGSYYSVYYPEKTDKDGDRYAETGEDFRAWQKDLALTARFDINEYWLIKLEGHYMDGAGALLASDNPDGFEKEWFMFAAKTTFNF